MSIFRHHTHTTPSGQVVPDAQHPAQAPELNASAGMTAVIMLACILAIIRGRRT